MYIYSSPFYLATTQLQCLTVIGRNGRLSILFHSCGFARHQRVLKRRGAHLIFYLSEVALIRGGSHLSQGAH